MHLRLVLWLAWLFFPVLVYAQQATVTGLVMDETGAPLEYASIIIKGKTYGSQTNAAGMFKITVPAEKDIVLVINYLSYQNQEIQLRLKNKENREIKVKLLTASNALSTIVVTDQNFTNANSAVSIMRLNPRITKQLPSAFNDFNKILATLPGVSSNNELTSTYSVRGGNYDENLVYVNGIEIYRPFLVSNAQQEGLSFVNPDLVRDVQFSSGGWQPKWGDKLSSVLNITYKTPKKLAGSVNGGLIGGGVHLEAASKDKRITYLAGVRYKNAQLVFNSLETNGNYQPSFTDAQSYITIDLTRKSRRSLELPKTTLGILASVARNKYEVIPFYRETSFGTRDRVVQLGIDYNGHERMEYESYQGGLNLIHRFTPKFFTEITASSVIARERELRDVAASYSFYEVIDDKQTRNPNEEVRNVEAGTDFEHSRNSLTAKIFALENRYTWQPTNRQEWQLGIKAAREDITDQLKEYRLMDSADYITVNQQFASNLKLPSYRYQGYGQHTWQLDSLRTLTYGVRLNYWTVNRELLISPRVQYTGIVPTHLNWSYKLALGVYYQPPFYRELRDRQGDLNLNLRAQKSLHFIAGAEYRYLSWNRPFKLTAEVYYKTLTNVVPYEVDNVRLRYFAQNNAKAYAAGIDLRVNGEFIRGAESWFSLGILTTKENISGDSTIYDLGTFKPVSKRPINYIRRPTDQRVTFGVFFQDHIPDHPSYKMYLNGVVGTGLPFSPPGNESIRNQFNMPFYKRVDIGFSKLLSFNSSTTDKTVSLESLWISLEILNLIAANNVVSYNYVKDVQNITYAVPNYLSSRLVNLRFIAQF
ncbi:TonB-dependent receptor [Adhaeribacter radiodurans]|uniref:TonB-dependent receptor n=1 Tax=Adhaeribacter radiodurans TaxID=2745197 RepID=A0A7L7L6H3_9BACT|nr:TonB-dependent receptor [Adhaeribacter radiodurans]QMU28432.1 TonB-dependent receptor [Adhaeribacter radiodurans]